MTLTEFLLARIAEDHERDEDAAFSRFVFGEVNAFDGALRAAWEDTTAVRWSRASWAFGDFVLAIASLVRPLGRRLVLPYADHPDYDPGWRL